MQDGRFFELLTLVKPEPLIRVLEKGMEIERLELIINPESEECRESIQYSSAILSFLRMHRLGS